MHIGASTHAELPRCSKTIGPLVEHHCLHGRTRDLVQFYPYTAPPVALPYQGAAGGSMLRSKWLD